MMMIKLSVEGAVRISFVPDKKTIFLLLVICFFCFTSVMAADIVIENARFRYAMSPTGKNRFFTDKKSGINYLSAKIPSFSASVMKDGKEYPVTAASLKNSSLHYEFGTSGVTADLKVSISADRIGFTVVAVKGKVESLTFVNVPLTTQGLSDDPFAACVLSMNLHTHVFQLPALQTHLKATCYQRFGLEKAEVTMLGVSQKDILPVIRDVMTHAKEIPHSTAGGAWAQLSKEGYGSYLMNFGTLTGETTEDWIKMCKNLGFTQIDNHGGGGFFKFGDFELDKKKWPGGWEDYKRINKRLHDAGISSIFHTYAFFIDKDSKYVTPVPNENLAYFSAFTLAEPVSANATEITVNEPTGNISMITGFFERNSVTIRIGKELVEFSGVTKTAPYKFTGCRRGALGTQAAAYPANEKAFHLREMFSRFVPGPETPLFTEIAQRTAEIVDQANFDGIYFDAIDGSDILAGSENFWYYGSKFVFEVAKHLKRPVGMEMSSMIHHWWHYRSRWQAWDRPTRGYKRFIDIHTASIKSDEYEHGLWRGNVPMINKLAPAENGGLLLPLQLGWWGHQTWNPPQVEPTFPDDIEYLGAKMIGNNAGLAMLSGFDQKTLDEVPAFGRLNTIILQYENLRHQNYFDESVRKQLRQPGKDFKLFQDAAGKWNFRPAAYQKHKVAGLTHPSASWTVNNDFDNQPVKLRIEPLMSVRSFEDTSNVVLSDFSAPITFTNEGTAKGVTGALTISSEKTDTGLPAATFSAVSNGESARDASWVKMEKEFEPTLNLEKNQGLGVWVKGDGNGQLLNLRVESPRHISHGARGDHFVKIDFTGWKYFELVEIESSEFSNYVWPAPYTSSSFYVYDSYRHEVAYKVVDKLQLWYNNLPAGKKVSSIVGPVKALPLVSTTITNPVVMIGIEKIVFPVAMESGMYLEYRSQADCKLYGSKGEFLRDVVPQGQAPVLKSGKNSLSFHCEGPKDVNPRIQVTVISEGQPLVKK